MTIAFKVVDPGVFQEAADDRVDFNITVEFRQVVAQAGNPPHQQLNLNSVSCRVVEVGDNLLIRQGVHLHPNQGRVARLGDRDLVVNLLVDEVANPVWRNPQLVEVRRASKTGEHVKEVGHVDP